MRALIACTLLAVACAQFNFPFWNGIESDRHNGYTFEYHKKHDLMLVRDSSNCYLVKAPNSWDAVFEEKSSRNTVEDEIIKKIKDNDGLTKISHLQALAEYRDPIELAECVRRKVYDLDYTYSP